ncbi:hypothetical protein GGR57DRAFT_481618 [Xylariaceae sp. FL1272]|nr:hypothetical protein GGR57DRAFT_481618 [Xylariaceae sp. FL1272]
MSALILCSIALVFLSSDRVQGNALHTHYFGLVGSERIDAVIVCPFLNTLLYLLRFFCTFMLIVRDSGVYIVHRPTEYCRRWRCRQHRVSTSLLERKMNYGIGRPNDTRTGANQSYHSC